MSRTATPARTSASLSGIATRDRRLQDLEQRENFPVALRILPRSTRADLQVVYDVARVIDELGDAASGDRAAQLRSLRADLARVWTDGRPDARVLRPLVAVADRHGLTVDPFDRLIRANLQDQSVSRYSTYADLLGYCALSANPVGEIVLAVFDATTPERVELSDRICSALQILEHCQDVAEDRRAGRLYLPSEDLDRFGVRPADLDAPSASVPVRELMRFEVDRAARLLRSGLPLLRSLRGWAMVAVTGYAAGGLATVDALRGADVLAAAPEPAKTSVLRHAVALLWNRS